MIDCATPFSLPGQSLSGIKSSFNRIYVIPSAETDVES